MTVLQDIQRLEPGDLIELFELDATGIGGDHARFHAYRLIGAIWWQGQQYDAWPMEAQDFTRTGGQQPRPILSVGNVNGSISALCMHFQDMIGARVIRRRTFAKYLDAANFPGGNANADPLQEMPPEVWAIDRKASEDDQTVSFELASPLDFGDAQLPGRQIIASRCGWITRGGYRGPYCGYAGPPVADADDQPTSDITRDRCSGRVAGCKLRFGANNPLPYGGFPAAGLMRT